MERTLNRSAEMIDREIKELKKELFRTQIETHKKKFSFYELQLQENRFLLEDVLNQLTNINHKFLQIVESIETCISEDKLKDQAKDIRRNAELINDVCELQIGCAKNYIINLSDLHRNCLKGKEESYV